MSVSVLTEHRPAGRWISPAARTFRGDLTGVHLAIGLPCYGGQLSAPTLHGLLETQRACLGLGLGFTCITAANESLVQRARNTLVAQFLASPATHLLFVDADIGFGADAALRLLGHGRPLIGGLYLRKSGRPGDWVVHWEEEVPETGATLRVPADPRTGAVRAARIGTGFMLIRRDVLAAMSAAPTAQRYRPHPADGPPGEWHNHTVALFDAAVEAATGRYISEDYLFCDRWRAMGGEVWCDPAIWLEHYGQACFTADPLADLSAR